jgi:hypothetical protein
VQPTATSSSAAILTAVAPAALASPGSATPAVAATSTWPVVTAIASDASFTATAIQPESATATLTTTAQSATQQPCALASAACASSSLPPASTFTVASAITTAP